MSIINPMSILRRLALNDNTNSEPLRVPSLRLVPLSIMDLGQTRQYSPLRVIKKCRICECEYADASRYWVRNHRTSLRTIKYYYISNSMEWSPQKIQEIHYHSVYMELVDSTAKTMPIEVAIEYIKNVHTRQHWSIYTCKKCYARMNLQIYNKYLISLLPKLVCQRIDKNAVQPLKQIASKLLDPLDLLEYLRNYSVNCSQILEF